MLSGGEYGWCASNFSKGIILCYDFKGFYFCFFVFLMF